MTIGLAEPARAARPEADGAGRAMARGPRAVPTTFATSPAFLHPADGDIGIVLAGGWGYEELCTRRALGELAEGLAGAGYPTLRFDLPGCGGALGDLADVRLDDWIAAVGAAAGLLRRVSGARRIALGGFGLGALIAMEAGRRGPGGAAHGAFLLAPPASGKRWLRETRLWAGQVASPGDGSDRVPEGALSIGGFVLPPALAAEISALKGEGFALPARGAAILALREGDERETAVFAARGAAVEQLRFAGFEDLVSGPTTARTPVETFSRAVALLGARLPPERAAGPADPAPAQVLEDGEFAEIGLRFGSDDYLFGVLCQPKPARAKAPVVVFLTVGNNPHSGWRRMTVEHARALAARGIASLRFDLGGVGESARLAGAPARIVYDDWPKRDIAAALDMLEARGFGPVTIVGICSGAWLGLRCALDEARVRGLVCVNLYRLVWTPDDESVEHAMRFANRPLAGAAQRFLTREKIVGVLRGRVDPRPGLRRVFDRIGRATVAAVPWLVRLGPRRRLYLEARRQFEILRAREVATTMCYGREDDGWADFQDHFGREGAGAAGFANVRLALIAGCDHNLTPPEAGAWLLREIEATIEAVEAAAARPS